MSKRDIGYIFMAFIILTDRAEEWKINTFYYRFSGGLILCNAKSLLDIETHYTKGYDKKQITLSYGLSLHIRLDFSI